MTSLAPLRPHQTRALDGLRASLLAGKRRPLLQAPCAFGKTVVSAHIVHGALAKGKRITFCVPALSLVDQTLERFRENGIDAAEMGVIQSDHAWRRPHAPVQIATAQTLARRDFPPCDAVVIDEAHVRHRVYETWMQHPAWLAKPFIGLSATPWAQGLGRLYDDLIKPTSIAELTALGLLSPFRAFAPSHPDLSGVRTVAGDYHEGDLAEAMGQATLVADVVSTWLTRGERRPTLCFGVNRAHAQQLTDQFRSAGVPVGYVDANTPRDERERVGRELEAGALKVVCNIGCLTTGVDWPFVSCIILARPTKSEILFVQIVGRGLRTAPGKSSCTILDHSDTHLRLGMITDIDFDELSDGRARSNGEGKRRERGIPLPKLCGQCDALVPAGGRTCLACGSIMGWCGVESVEGELEELTAARARVSNSKRIGVSGALRAMGKREIIGQLYRIRDERGRSNGWVAHTYRAIFDVWPRGLDDVEISAPHPMLRSFVRSRDIAFAKSRRADGGGNGTL